MLKIIPIIGLLALTNCAGTLVAPDPTITADIQKAQILVQRTCGAAPTVATLVNMFTSNPTVSTIENIVATLCSHAEVKKLKRSYLYNKYRKFKYRS